MVLSFVSSSSIKSTKVFNHDKDRTDFLLLIILIGSEFSNVYMIAKDFKNQNNPFLFDIPKFCGKKC